MNSTTGLVTVIVGITLAVTGIITVLVGVVASIMIVGVMIVSVTVALKVGDNSNVGSAVDDGVMMIVGDANNVGDDVGEAASVIITVAVPTTVAIATDVGAILFSVGYFSFEAAASVLANSESWLIKARLSSIILSEIGSFAPCAAKTTCSRSNSVSSCQSSVFNSCARSYNKEKFGLFGSITLLYSDNAAVCSSCTTNLFALNKTFTSSASIC